MLRRSPIDGPIPVAELQTTSRSSSSLLPLPNITPNWSLMSKVQRPTTLKPLLQDRLRRLPNASVLGAGNDFSIAGGESDGKDGSTAERRIRFLENSIQFLRQEHDELLTELHREVDSLKRTNQSTSYCVNLSHKFLKSAGANHASVAIL